MRIFFLGDIVGEPGRRIVRDWLPTLRQHHGIDFVVANAENAAGGSGLTVRCYNQIMAGGVDACTMGDHVYREKEIFKLFDRGAPICRPANYPHTAPGPDHLLLRSSHGTKIAILCVLGRLFMKPVDCPFQAVDRVLAAIAEEAQVILLDIHAEATSEKQTMLRHVLGRVSLVVGTHTHVPTADAAVHSPGTAYITDLGMTGPYDSIIGRRVDRVLGTTLSFKPSVFEVAEKDPRISGVLVDVDELTGAAESIRFLQVGEQEFTALAATVDSGGSQESTNGANTQPATNTTEPRGTGKGTGRSGPRSESSKS